jgi:hypothetical protein
VFRAGQPLAMEIPILAVVYGIPALAAWLSASKLGT